ncbi:hypothetical protein OG897_31765 [Streptomyces sp. NBC_00237]|uniref:hypothetical protein n=1 Tax=Streptomyces sp. NBC_00237 TaxID=2975687 RepID=UPI00225116AE|nr:hypothetical protein [Streptomyces sp. NBC_00237]MCX5205984.1 hypothetical protein [Streptomyces sp. NBC_00237]
MITVIETWHLNEESTPRALELMQEMDELTGPDAHRNPGWSGHAHFYQSEADPARVTMIYPWSNRDSHEGLRDAEEPRLQEFYAKYCSSPRLVEYATEMPVEVEHDDDHGHDHSHHGEAA